MARRLGPDEAALWARVAGTVRPLPGRIAPTPPPGPRAPRAGDEIVDRAPPRAPVRKPAANATPVDAATLDGSWDRAMRTGRLSPDMTVDLHGYSRERAHAVLSAAIAAAARGGARVLLVITGKGRREEEGHRGVIRASLRDWLHGPELRPFIAALRPAHPRHGGGGAWYVILRRG